MSRFTCFLVCISTLQNVKTRPYAKLVAFGFAFHRQSLGIYLLGFLPLSRNTRAITSITNTLTATHFISIPPYLA